MKRRAFSLLELLVVILAITVLITIIVPALSRSMDSGRRILCRTNLRSMHAVFLDYYLAQKTIPVDAGPFEIPPKSLKCPNDKAPSMRPTMGLVSSYNYAAWFYMKDAAQIFIGPAEALRKYETGIVSSAGQYMPGNMLTTFQEHQYNNHPRPRGRTGIRFDGSFFDD